MNVFIYFIGFLVLLSGYVIYDTHKQVRNIELKEEQMDREKFYQTLNRYLAYEKCVKTIDSCTTIDHLDKAKKLCENHLALFLDRDMYNNLRSLIRMKLKEIDKGDEE